MFKPEDFTDDELALLRMAFKLLDASIEGIRELNYANYVNDVYHLKYKLGIDGLVEI